MKSKVSLTKQKKIAIVKITLGFGFLLLVYLIPFFWVCLTSIKPETIISSMPPLLFFKPTGDHFLRLHFQWDFFTKMYHSLVIASGTTAICIVAGSLSAYALSRFKIRGKKYILLWILSHRFLPMVAILFPLFMFFKRLQLIDTYVSVILSTTVPNLAFSIWLLDSFFSEIPPEIEEAAKVDGCTDWNLLWRVIFPIAKPAIAVTALFVFLFSWNEFFIPLVLTRTNVPPVTVGFAAFRQHLRMDWGAMAAASVVTLGPLLAMVVLLHRFVVRGLTLGAVKE